MAGKGPKRDGRTRIVEGAIRCFIRRGVASTTLREITAAAGVDQPLFHYHFKSLDELYGDVVQSVRMSLNAASVAILEGVTDPREQVAGYIEGTLRWGLENPGLHSVWIYFYYLATYQPTFAALNSDFRLTGRDRMELFIHRGLEQGVFHLAEGRTVSETAFCIHTYLTGGLVIGGSGEKADKTKEWQKTLDLALKGAFAWLGTTPP